MFRSDDQLWSYPGNYDTNMWPSCQMAEQSHNDRFINQSAIRNEQVANVVNFVKELGITEEQWKYQNSPSDGSHKYDQTLPRPDIRNKPPAFNWTYHRPQIYTYSSTKSQDSPCSMSTLESLETLDRPSESVSSLVQWSCYESPASVEIMKPNCASTYNPTTLSTADDAELSIPSPIENRLDSEEQVNKMPIFPWMTKKSERKRTRQTYSREVSCTLEMAYVKRKYITKKERLQLAQSVGLSDRKVKVWFQNRRMKEKKEMNGQLLSVKLGEDKVPKVEKTIWDMAT